MLTSLRHYATARSLSVLLLGAAALLAVIFLPALFRNESALQIRASHQGIALPDGFYVYQRLNAQGIRIKSITPDNDALVITFDSLEQSTAAEKALRKLLPSGFDIAQLESDSPLWISHISLRNKASMG